MLCVDTRVAAKIFNISTSALKEAVRRNSTKYKFVRLQNAGTRSRGGVKLLFGVDVTDMMAAINTKKCNPNVCVYVFKNGKYEAVEFTKILKNSDEFGGNLTANLDGNGVNINSALKTQRTQAAQDIKARITHANTKKGAIALEKERILKAYERAKKSGVKSLNFIKNINANPTFFLKLSANKLFAWQRAYKESGFAGLIDERKSNRENIIDALGLSEIAQKFILSTDKKNRRTKFSYEIKRAFSG
jgi:prophage Mu protein